MELFKLLGTIAIENSDANNSIDETTGKVEHSEGKITSALKKIGAAVVSYVAVDKIKSFGQECVNMASDVQEVQNKFDVVFQGMTDDVEDWAKTYADSIGRNSNTIKTYLADNQNMFVGMGMTREEGAKLSEQMVELGLDLASFNNLQEDEAVNALSKALMGETESAKRLGAVLNDNTLAMAQEQLGYEGKFDALTEAQKMEVRYQAILNQSQDAVGDCARSLDSYKGRQIQAQSAMENLKETIGTRLLPYMTLMQEKFGAIVGTLSEYVNPAFDKLEEVAGDVGELWREVLQPAIKDVGDGFLAVWDALQPVIQSFTDMLPEVEGNMDAMDIFREACWKVEEALGLLSEILQSVAQWISEHQTAVEVIATIIGSVAAAVVLVNTAVSIWTTIAGVATAATTALGAAVAFLTSPIGIAIAILTALIAVGVLVYKNWDTIKEKCSEFAKTIKETITKLVNSVKSTVSSVLNAVKSTISSVLNTIKTTVSSVINSISSTVSSVFNGIWSTTVSIWNAVKDAIVSPIETAKNMISGILDTISGLFSSLNISFPSIPLPHFAISPAGWKIGDLLKGSIPSLSIEWYAKAMNNPMIMEQATAFGVNGNGQIMAGGEKGSEVVSGTETLMKMISQAVAEQNGALISVLTNILDAILNMDDNMGGNLCEAIAGTSLKVNNREFARLVKAVN